MTTENATERLRRQSAYSTGVELRRAERAARARRTGTTRRPVLRIPLLPVQFAFMDCSSRYQALITGIGYGKTWVGARKGVSLTVRFPGTQGLACSNSYRQLEDVVIPEIEAAAKHFGVPCRFEAGKARFVFANGSKILCRSLDKTAMNKLRGTAFVWAWLDEARDMPEKAFKIVQGRIGRKRGPAAQLFLTTTPNGFNWIYKHFGPLKKDPRGEYSIFHARTADNTTLPSDFVPSLTSAYDERMAAQELDGAFTAPENTLYSAFDRTKNVSRRARYDPTAPLAVALDFNVNPCVAGIIQEFAGRTCVVDEIWNADGDGTPGVIRAFGERYGYDVAFEIYGDPAGHARRSNAGKSDYELWKDAFPNARVLVPRSTYPIVDRVNSVNHRLKQRDGTRLLFVNPSCVHLIEDFEQVMPKKDGSRAPRKEADAAHLSHISDAVGYYVVHVHSVRARVDMLKRAIEDGKHGGKIHG